MTRNPTRELNWNGIVFNVHSGTLWCVSLVLFMMSYTLVMSNIQNSLSKKPLKVLGDTFQCRIVETSVNTWIILPHRRSRSFLKVLFGHLSSTIELHCYSVISLKLDILQVCFIQKSEIFSHNLYLTYYMHGPYYSSK